MLPLEPFIDQIEKIIRNLRPSNYIVVMNSNARSNLWFANETDARRKAVEVFLIDNKLYVVNVLSELPTYFTTNKQSNIDVTLASEEMHGKCVNWIVFAACTTSDHNLIFVLESGWTQYQPRNSSSTRTTILKELIGTAFTNNWKEISHKTPWIN